MAREESNYTHRIWRALDAESSFFGIRGRFILLFLLGCFAGAAISLCLMTISGNVAGTLCLAATLAGSYLWVMAVQSRMTVRQFSRMLSSRRLARWSRVRPISVKEKLNNAKT